MLIIEFWNREASSWLGSFRAPFETRAKISSDEAAIFPSRAHALPVILTRAKASDPERQRKGP